MSHHTTLYTCQFHTLKLSATDCKFKSTGNKCSWGVNQIQRRRFREEVQQVALPGALRPKLRCMPHLVHEHYSNTRFRICNAFFHQKATNSIWQSQKPSKMLHYGFLGALDLGYKHWPYLRFSFLSLWNLESLGTMSGTETTLGKHRLNIIP